MVSIFATVKLLCHMPTRKIQRGERHGTPAERVLAASNPGTQKNRPHTMFVSGPPTLPGVPQANGAVATPVPPRPFANGPMPPAPVPAIRPPAMQPNMYPPMQMPPPQAWQGQPMQPGSAGMPQQQMQFRGMPPPPPPQVAPPLNRPPPPPAAMGGNVWRPPPPPQHFNGGHHPMQHVSMPPPPPPAQG